MTYCGAVSWFLVVGLVADALMTYYYESAVGVEETTRLVTLLF